MQRLWAGAIRVRHYSRVKAGGSVSVGDTINLDIDSLGHGNEKVTVKSIGGNPAAQAPAADDDATFFVAAPAAPGDAGTQNHVAALTMLPTARSTAPG